MPAATAASIVATDSASSAGPYIPDMPISPSPSAPVPTAAESVPSLRVIIVISSSLPWDKAWTLE